MHFVPGDQVKLPGLTESAEYLGEGTCESPGCAEKSIHVKTAAGFKVWFHEAGAERVLPDNEVTRQIERLLAHPEIGVHRGRPKRTPIEE